MKAAIKAINDMGFRVSIHQTDREKSPWQAIALGPNLEMDNGNNSYTRGVGHGKTMEDACTNLLEDLENKGKNPSIGKPKKDSAKLAEDLFG